MLSLVTLHECGSGSARRSQDEGASTGTRPERTALGDCGRVPHQRRARQPRRDQVRVLIHRQHGHPMRGLVREPEAIILHRTASANGPPPGTISSGASRATSPITVRTRIEAARRVRGVRRRSSRPCARPCLRRAEALASAIARSRRLKPALDDLHRRAAAPPTPPARSAPRRRQARMPAGPRCSPACSAARRPMKAPSPVTTAVSSTGMTRAHSRDRLGNPRDLRGRQRVGDRRHSGGVQHLPIGADRPRQPLAGELARGRAAIGRGRGVVGRREIASPDVDVAGQRKAFGREPRLAVAERHVRRDGFDRASARRRSRPARPTPDDRDRSIPSRPRLRRRWERCRCWSCRCRRAARRPRGARPVARSPPSWRPRPRAASRVPPPASGTGRQPRRRDDRDPGNAASTLSSTKLTPSRFVRNICDSSAVIVTACASPALAPTLGGERPQHLHERAWIALQLERPRANGEHAVARHACDLGVHSADIPAEGLMSGQRAKGKGKGRGQRSRCLGQRCRARFKDELSVEQGRCDQGAIASGASQMLESSMPRTPPPANSRTLGEAALRRAMS